VGALSPLNLVFGSCAIQERRFRKLSIQTHTFTISLTTSTPFPSSADQGRMSVASTAPHSPRIHHGHNYHTYPNHHHQPPALANGHGQPPLPGGRSHNPPPKTTKSVGHTVSYAQQQVGASVTQGMQKAFDECKATVERIAAQCRAKNRKFR
jgi:hypothetical protein